MSYARVEIFGVGLHKDMFKFFQSISSLWQRFRSIYNYYGKHLRTMNQQKGDCNSLFWTLFLKPTMSRINQFSSLSFLNNTSSEVSNIKCPRTESGVRNHKHVHLRSKRKGVIKIKTTTHLQSLMATLQRKSATPVLIFHKGSAISVHSIFLKPWTKHGKTLKLFRILTSSPVKAPLPRIGFAVRSLIYGVSFLESLIFDGKFSFDQPIFFRSQFFSKIKLSNHYHFIFAKLKTALLLGIHYSDIHVYSGGQRLPKFDHISQVSHLLKGKCLLFKGGDQILNGCFRNSTMKIISMFLSKIVWISWIMILDFFPTWVWKIYTRSGVLRCCLESCEPLVQRRPFPRDSKCARASIADYSSACISNCGPPVNAAYGCTDAGSGDPSSGSGASSSGTEDTRTGFSHVNSSSENLDQSGLRDMGGDGEGGGSGEGERNSDHQSSSSDIVQKFDVLWVKYISSVSSPAMGSNSKLLVKSGSLNEIRFINELAETINEAINMTQNSALKCKLIRSFQLTTPLVFHLVDRDSCHSHLGTLQPIPGNIPWTFAQHEQSSPVLLCSQSLVTVSDIDETHPPHQISAQLPVQEAAMDGSVAHRVGISELICPSDSFTADTSGASSFSESYNLTVKYVGPESQSTSIKVVVDRGLLQGVTNIAELAVIINTSFQLQQNLAAYCKIQREFRLRHGISFVVVGQNLNGTFQPILGTESWEFPQESPAFSRESPGCTVLITGECRNDEEEDYLDWDAESETTASSSECPDPLDNNSCDVLEDSSEDISSSLQQVPSAFPAFSARCRERICNGLFFAHKKSTASTLMEALGIDVSSLPSKTTVQEKILRLGLGSGHSHRDMEGNNPHSSRDMQGNNVVEGVGGDVVLSDSETGAWEGCDFPAEVLISDLGLSAVNRDAMSVDKRISVAHNLLLTFLQSKAGPTCRLRHSVEGKELIVIDELKNESAKASIRIFCSTKKEKADCCTYKVRYKYTDAPTGGRYAPENANVPIFKRSPTKRNESGRQSCCSQHSCNKKLAALEYQKGFCQGSQYLWTSDRIEKALVCLHMGAKLPTICSAFGHDAANAVTFPRNVRHLRDVIRNYLLKQNREGFVNLKAYFKGEVDSGRTGYVDLDVWPDAPSTVRRIFWIRASQLCEPKAGTVHAVSLDFLYNVFKTHSDKHPRAAFGHLTTLGPEGTLIVVAQFIVEGERSEAITWIHQKYKESLDFFGIASSQVFDIFLAT